MVSDNGFIHALATYIIFCDILGLYRESAHQTFLPTSSYRNVSFNQTQMSTTQANIFSVLAVGELTCSLTR